MEAKLGEAGWGGPCDKRCPRFAIHVCSSAKRANTGVGVQAAIFGVSGELDRGAQRHLWFRLDGGWGI